MDQHNNDEHIRWLKELAELGFPQGDIGKDFQMLGVANSNYSGIEIPKSYISCDFSAGTYIGTTIAPILSLAIGIGFQDVIAGLLCWLPGRDSVKGGFYCLPGTSIGQKVTHIEIGYKKDFLWMVPIKKTIFSYSGYYSNSCLFDTYPSSLYDGLMDRQMTNSTHDSFPLVYDYGLDVTVNPIIPFIPTSSALACCGDGINISSSMFTIKPSVVSTPFGLNYRMEDNVSNHGHSCFAIKTQEWIENHLGISIDGPSSGYTSAKYSLANAKSSVTWSSSDASIATINQQGILTVKENGVVQILAQSDDISYSKTIIVGLPRYIQS